MDVQRALKERGKQQQGLACVADLRASVTRSSLSRAVARGDVVRVRPAVYALNELPPWPVHAVTPTGVAPDFVQHVRAVLLSLGDGATASGPTAACLRGWGLLHEPVRTVDVTVAMGRSRIRLAGVRSLQRRRVARELCEPLAGERGIWVTAPATTVLDCCRRLPLLDAVVLCDSALRSRQITLTELRRAAARLRGVRHARRVRKVLGLCDPKAGSVLESVLRMTMVRDGIAGFTTQRVIRDANKRHIVRADFCFDDRKLVVETDGARWHRDTARDQGLDNRLAAAGWRVLRFSWAQVVHDPAAVLRLIRAALSHGSQDVHLGAEEVAAAA